MEARTPHAARYPIPQRLNLALGALLLILLPAAWAIPMWAPASRAALAAGASAFAFIFYVAHALLHESLHRRFHRDPRANYGAGFALSVFVPSSYTLFRFNHSSHHVSNRSKHERIEYYARGESRFARAVAYYVLIGGGLWLGTLLHNLVVLVLPIRLLRRLHLDTNPDRQLPRLSDRTIWRIRAETVAVAAIHVAAIYLGRISVEQYAVFYAAVGFTYSSTRNVPHYRSSSHVTDGAFDLRSHRWVSALFLHTHLHRTHHRYPLVPWTHLPALRRGGDPQPTFGAKYVEQWQGVMMEEPKRAG